jgi:hypothetical protein
LLDPLKECLFEGGSFLSFDHEPVCAINGIAFDKGSIVGTDGRRRRVTDHDVAALMQEKNPTILINDKVTHRFLKEAQMVRI